MSDTHMLLGEHEAKIDVLIDGQNKIVTNLEQINRTLAIREGERRGVKILAAAVSAIVGFTASILAILSSKFLGFDPTR